MTSVKTQPLIALATGLLALGAAGCGTSQGNQTQDIQVPKSTDSAQSSDSTCGVVSRLRSGEFEMLTFSSRTKARVLPEDSATANTLTLASRQRSLVCIQAPVIDGSVTLRSLAFLNVSTESEMCGKVVTSQDPTTSSDAPFELEVMNGLNYIPLSPQDGASFNLLSEAVASGQSRCIIADYQADPSWIEVRSAAFIRVPAQFL